MNDFNYKNGSRKDIKEEIIRILDKYLSNNYLLIIFGSFVRNEMIRSSDIDLAVYRNEKIPTKTIVEAKEELKMKTHTLRDIDLINLTKDVNVDLLKKILEEGVIWKETKNSKGLLKNLKKRLISTKK
ncbi:nucleotidyltransferase domain-containing protein [bacterium]|nr:nucleotidyltransferase domain-containing protein [bacterium]